MALNTLHIGWILYMAHTNKCTVKGLDTYNPSSHAWCHQEMTENIKIWKLLDVFFRIPDKLVRWRC